LGAPGAPDELVFAGPLSGKHLWYGRFRERVWMRALEKAMNPELCAAAGLTPLTRQPTIHALRHSHASWLIAAGAPLPYIQARLWPDAINATDGVYGHLLRDAQEMMATWSGDIVAAPVVDAELLEVDAVLELEEMQGDERDRAA